jgi:hypothetical protein
LYDRHGSACLLAAGQALLGVDAAESLVFDVFMTTWRTPADTGGSLRQQLVNRTLAKAHELGKHADVKIQVPAPTPL